MKKFAESTDRPRRPAHRTALIAAMAAGLLIAAAACSSSGGATTDAAGFPEAGRRVTMIVPYSVGGGTDIGARLLANDLNKILDVEIEVINKVGASGQIGLTQLVGSKPDGYTWAWANTPITSPIYLDPKNKAAFGPEDLVPIGNYVFDANMILVGKNSPYKTLTELLDAARAAPNKISVSLPAVGSPGDQAISALEDVAGVKFSRVYITSAGQQKAAVLGGQVDSESNSVAATAELIKSGELRALAIFDSKRSTYLPDVPTAEEQGFKVLNGSSRILVVPKGTPKSIVDTLSTALKKATEEQTQRGDLAKAYLEPRYMDSAQTTEYMRQIDQQVDQYLKGQSSQ